MVRIIFFYLLTLCNFSIFDCTTSDPSTVTGVRFIRNLPLGSIGHYENMKSSYDIYHCGNLVQYRTTRHYVLIHNGAAESSGDQYEYFVYQKDSTFGIEFKDNAPGRWSGNETNRRPVDSATSGYKDYFNTFEEEKDKEPDSSYWYGENKLVNIYEFKKRDQYPENATYYYWYSHEFKDVPEKYSNKFDTAKGLKLFKIVGHMHGGYYEKQNFSTDEREYVFEMQRPSLEELKTAAVYFKRYRNLNP